MTKQIYYLGIDIGLKGGLALLDENKKILGTLKMPFIEVSGEKIVDFMAIGKFTDRAIIEKGTETLVYDVRITIENIHYGRFPRTAYSIGTQKAVILAYFFKSNPDLISPQKWKKHFMLSTSSVAKADKKNQSLEICKKYYPNDVKMWTGRNGGLQDRIAEAILIARYGVEKDIEKE